MARTLVVSRTATAAPFLRPLLMSQVGYSPRQMGRHWRFRLRPGGCGSAEWRASRRWSAPTLVPRRDNSHVPAFLGRKELDCRELRACLQAGVPLLTAVLIEDQWRSPV